VDITDLAARLGAVEVRLGITAEVAEEAIQTAETAQTEAVYAGDRAREAVEMAEEAAITADTASVQADHAEAAAEVAVIVAAEAALSAEDQAEPVEDDEPKPPVKRAEKETEPDSSDGADTPKRSRYGNSRIFSHR
jgi:hypothetical protein